MNRRWLLWGSVLLVVLTATADCRKRKRNFIGKRKAKYADMMLADEPLFTVESIAPFQTTKIGNCECKCCQPPPAPLLAPQCENDIIVAVDSSACFRDHHRRMKQFLQRLVNEIHKSKNFQFGLDKTRLAIMQFSSEQNIPIRLDAFDNYQEPDSSKQLKSAINQGIAELGFLGQGAYLDAALNATVQHFTDARARPNPVGNVQKTVIVLTNGKSHPKVTPADVENAMKLMKTDHIKVLPVSVTRQCYSYSPDWDEGLCPDVNILKMLGDGFYTDGEDFLPMRASGTVGTVVKEATACQDGPAPLVDSCNTCNCSCELPIGPRGFKGQRGIDGSDGDKGDKGEIGEVGKPGEIGRNGTKGSQGEKGDAGADGLQGEKGDIGPVGGFGLPGEKGEPGENGTIGEIGPRGFKGENGTKGEIGEQGDQGHKGASGVKGARGGKGATGIDGQKGANGTKGEPGIGIKGSIGNKGDKGDKGENGTVGEPGNKGLKGERGLCGKPGPAGSKGAPGLPGIDGADGEIGEPGTQGPRGQEGIQGQKGSRGELGRDGGIGPAGPVGSPGPEGLQGPRGPAGQNGSDSNVPGPTGPEGPRGPKGGRGLPGRDGLHGLQGASGEQGPRGLVGQKGEEGAIDKESLRPFLVELIRELLPGDCGYNPPTEETDITVPEPTPPSPLQDQRSAQCADSRADIAFLISGSSAISSEDFYNLLRFLHGAIKKSFEPTNSLGFRFSIIQYSDNTSTILRFEESINKNVILSAIDNLLYIAGDIRTGNALEDIRYVFEDIRNSGNRVAVPQIAVVFTDGSSEDGVTEPAQALRDAGVKVIAVGVTEHSSHGELINIASSIELVHNITSSKYQETLLRGICKCARGSYVVYDEYGNPTEHVVFEGDDELVTQASVEEPETSGVDYDSAARREEDGELP